MSIPLINESVYATEKIYFHFRYNDALYGLLSEAGDHGGIDRTCVSKGCTPDGTAG
jgi:hypothetical protein